MKNSANPQGEYNFFENVYEVVKCIPQGRVTSYGAIAKFLGTSRSSRMVGWALNNCHTKNEFIPAHRVVNRNGVLSGKHHFGGNTIMQQLLENENIVVEDDRIKDFDKIFWDPNTELK